MERWQPVVDAADQLGESPFWHPHERRLYWIDIPGRRLRRVDPADGRVDSWPVPQDPGCIAPARSGGLVVALRDGIYRARRWGGDLELLQPAPYDAATTRFNDGKADPRGRFWAGTLFEPKHAARAELFSLEAGAALARLAGEATTGNGLAWSPAADTVYWADTQAHAVRAWDWDAAGNRLARPRLFHQFAPKPAGWQPGQPGYGGRPDGAAVDRDGNYWCALYEGGRLVQLSPAGTLLQELATPMPCPTMPCFGGDDLRTLYLTSAGNRPAAERAHYPLSGRVVATRVAVPGLAVNFFSD
ncbi:MULTISPECIES: SMP-30/gluconolactonase/LRE family protein [Ramlibacter]|uniref:SMP-30/gluconolactonase/LRE family protein n=1 Tax=Ramlibacter pinisoli TaxID=2682844 RepID=A0A6N8IP33_9BURK|nr:MULTISPECIES: SMP-30/gluconolactonase/LRE family protein [Ramlibacter]MBA2960656.1 SMP-30/gluconolactonase/LRE family protein [Ramlibacter sp. CGMCC 1.13660]MVQ27986.1 SMP-30/gluconolactonase/LRE family protein [Ramlibacter pinisoli]